MDRDKEQYRFVSAEFGGPSVITPGTAVMLVWSVGSWDTPCLVRNSNLNCGIWVHTGCLPVNAWLYLLHSTGAIPLSNAYYGSGTGPVLIDNVSCTGNEQFLANCTNNGVGVTSLSCGHDDDAGVQCPGINLQNVPLFCEQWAIFNGICYL